MKVTVAIPTNRSINAKTSECLLNLIEHGGYEFNILIAEEGYTIAENRNYIAVKAVNSGSDYLLMIDDDMTFEPDLLDKMVAQNKDILGVAYHSRGSKDKIKLVEDDIMAIAETEKGKYINLVTNPDPKYKKTFEVYATGTGIILIKCEVFYKIKQPFFEFTYYQNGKCKEGEDWNFCFKAKDAGYKIWTDPTIKVGHLGEIIY